MVGQPVGLDDQAEVRPEEVDPEAVRHCCVSGIRQLCPLNDAQEASLELRVGEPEGCVLPGWNAAAPRRALPGNASSAASSVLGIEQTEPIRLVDHPLQTGPNRAARRDRSRCAPAWSPGWPCDGHVDRQQVGTPIDADASHACAVRRQGSSLRSTGGDRPIPQSAAALPWLRTAPGPQARTAAIQRPSRPSAGRPTA